MIRLLLVALFLGGCASMPDVPPDLTEARQIESKKVLAFMEDVDLAADQKTIEERLAIRAGRIKDFSIKLNALRCVGDSYCKPQIDQRTYQAGRSFILTIIERAQDGIEQLRIEDDAQRVLARLEDQTKDLDVVPKGLRLEIERQRGRIEQARRLQMFYVNTVETATKDIFYITEAPEEWQW